ncbi:MAG: 3-oxoacyl-ACP reductase FabG [Clostridia bacterium]|nr:3-oxoacyl-ACP reductase FabG [Clostridia bacterium]
MSVVLVTGGAGGIGSEISVYFARRGYDVAIQYNSGRERAEQLATEIRSTFKVMAVAVGADFEDEKSVCDMFEEVVKTLGAPDVVVNNAGISEQRLFTDVTPQEWQRMVNVNMSAAFYICQCAAPYMIKKQKGAIVNVSSMWGISGASCEVAYSATKAGIIGMTKALARELGPSGIRVNCVAPGVIETKMNAVHSAETMKELAEETPLCRIGKPEEVAAAVYFLASEEASFITGQTLCVDGGFLNK